MFGQWGMWELLLVFLIVVLLFGANKLPQVGRSLGDFISEFRESIKGKPKNEKPENAPDKEDQ